MRYTKTVFCAALALCAAQAFAAHTEVATAPRLPFMRGMGFDGYYEGRNRTWMTRKDVYTGLVAKGFDHVRLPVDFRDYSSYDSSTGVATLKETTTTGSWWNQTQGPGFATFDTVISNAIDAGLYIVLDFHGWFTIDPTDAASTNQFVALWKAVAERYKDYPNKLVFELANEPKDNSHYTAVCNMQKAAIAEIRKTNPTRLILFDPGDASQPWVLTRSANHAEVSLPAGDNNIAVVVHCYNPGYFTHQGESWSSGSSTTNVPFSAAYRGTLNWDLDQCRLYMEGTGNKLVINEFNVSQKLAARGDITEYLSIVTRFCEANRIPWAPWIYYADTSSFDCFSSYGANAQLKDFVKAGLFPDIKPTDEFSASDYAHFIDIAFPGYSGPETLADFPVLVKLSEGLAGFRYADFARGDGFDLCFTDANGKLLAHEIDTWNTNGVSSVWVKIPSLTTSTTIKAHYGCVKPIVPKVESVWDSDYVGVWHLGEQKLPLADSTGASRDITSADGSGIGYGVAGIAGGAVDFGATGAGRCVNADDHANLDGFQKMTIEAWTYQTSRPTGSDKNTGILGKRNSAGSQASYYLYDNGTAQKTSFYVSSSGSSSQAAGNLVPTALNVWNHQVHTFDGSQSANNAKGYLNGEYKSSGTANVSQIFAGSAELHIGSFQSGDTRNFPGRIDEVRISKCVRSADWIKATHDTIANAAFATYAVDGIVPEEPPAPQVVSASDAAGFDYTNRLVTVTGLAAGETVTLSTERAGTTTAMTATADANGEAVFNVATAPGAVYSYAVSRDGTKVASGGFVTGGWNGGGSWFRGAFAAGAPVASGGSWMGTPQLTADGSAVAGDAQFALDAAARAAGSNRLARVEFDFTCEGMKDEISLAADLAPMFGGVSAVALSAGGTAWFAWDGIAWHRLYGEAAPEIGGAYVVRAELDFAASPKTVRYFVSSDGGGTFAPLFADAECAA
ncbi:MAG: cellulase family glycosylhydrolase, partial [Kiritimatiellae bacterium]|nr:cellulase family glycosylhydrolase [Kiritimatiellia bacterium]